MSKFVLTAQLQLQAPTNITQVVNQMQRQLNNVQVNIQAQGAPAAAKQINNVTKATNNATSAANRMGKAFAVSIKRFAAFSIATRAVGLFTTTIGNAVSEAIDFERQLLKVSQVTGKTMSQLKDLTGEINRLSTGLGVASKSLLDVSRTLSQAGLSARDTKIALDSLAKTTLAPTFDDITQTAEGAVAVMAQFKQGAAALEKQLGAINAVAGQFAVEAGDLISVIRRTGGVFKEAGGDLNELIGLFTSVRATTRESADSIATGLRTIFTRIQRPKTIEFLKQFGVELTGMDGKFVGAFEAVSRLSDALKGLEQGDIRFIKIAEQLGGFRQIGKVIPLLKEFRTAEEARQAAIAGGNSLTEDAAAAQATLAVQITKVQESFAKLMRDITETSTFQIIAKSALAFADSLIRIADAIKPLLPILAALAAFKLAKTFGQFGAGLATGIKNLGANVQGANNGGRIQHFARGGMVPGTGNSDTVPAMLQPGEFVIKKSSVKGIGASRLASMNKGGMKKYARGGKAASIGGDADVILELNPGEIGGFFLNPAGGEETRLRANSETKALTGQRGAGILGLGTQFDKSNPGASLQGLTADQLLGLGLLTPSQAKGSKNKKAANSEYAKLRGARKKEVDSAILASHNSGDLQRVDKKSIRVQSTGEISSFLPGLSEIESDPTVAAEVAKRTREGLAAMVENATSDVYTNVFGGMFPLDPTAIQDAVTRIQADANAVNTTEGFVFEGLINAMTGAKPAGEMSNFDFPSTAINGKKDKLAKFFGGATEMKKLVKADAKKTLSNSQLKNIAGKVIGDLGRGDTGGIGFAIGGGKSQKPGQIIRQFAKGGSVSDTVPAMLTPGEYVINKRSAQQIGYGALGKMNKHGAQGFAKGGAVGGVQYFENGDEVKPLAPGGNLPGPKLDKLNAEFAALALEVAELEAELSSVNAMLDESEVALDAHTKQILESKKAELESVTESKKGSLDAKGESVEIESRRVAAGSSGIKPPPKEPPPPVVKADTVIAAPTPTSSVPQDMFAPIVAGSDPMVGAGSLVPGGTPSPALSGDALGSSTQEVSTKINGLGQVIEQLIGNVNQFDTGISAATAEVTTSFAQVGTSQQGLVNINQQVVNSGGQLDTINDQVVQGLQEQSQALDRSTQELTEQIAASDNAAAADRQKAEQTAGATKSSIGLTAAFFAMQSVLAMLPTEIEETDGVFKRMVKTGVKTTLSLLTLGFIVKQVAGEQTLASIATKLKTAADLKAAGTTSAASLAAAGGMYRLSAAANFASASLKNLGMGAGVGFALVAAASYLFFASMQSLADEAKQAAIESGNIDTAGTEALNASAYGTAAVLSVVAIAALAAAVAVGAVTLPFAAVAVAIGVVVAAGLAFAGQFEGVMNLIRDGLSALTFGLIASTTVIRTRAEADAAATNAAERLKEATESVSEAFKAVTDGSKTAVQALLENSDAQRAFNSAGDATRRELLANAEEEGTGSDARGLRNRRKVIGQFITQKGTEDGVSDDTKAQMEALGIDDAEVKAFKESTDKIFDLIKEEADIRARAAKEMIISGRGMVGDEAISQAEFVAEQIARIGPAFEQLTPDQQADIMEDLSKEYENQLKAVIDNIKTLNLFNFGLTETNGAIAMASAKIDNLNMAFDSGASRIRSSINKLSTIIEDGATMDPAELQQNLTAINKELSNFGVDPRSVDNITKQFGALNTVQSSFRIETEKLVAEMQTSGAGFGSPEAFTEKLQERLSQVAIAGGADETAVNKLMTSLPDLSSDDVTALMAGDTSVLADGFSEVNDKLKATLETMAKIASLTEEVAKLNADRLDAETALFAAQKTAIDLQVEGAQIQAKFGGKVVSSAVLRQSAISKANVGTSRSGLSDLQSGSVGEIRRRNEQIRAGVFSIQSGGRANVAGGGGFFGAGPQVTGAGFSSQGQTTEAREKALRQAQQEQISTIKALIAAEEAHLKTIQEKNRLEKESLQSLVDGDVEEFLKKQAAVGATAAIATGDTRLQGIFGAEALGGAFKNLETQQAAGVTDLFGQQIGGAGGLLEQASGAALSARGVTDPRMAALMAGTTGAEEASKTNIRDLAGELGATGDVGVGIAEMDLETAEFKVAQATIVVQKAMQETQTKSREAANIREDAQKRSNDILKRSEEELKKIEANTAPLNERGSAYTHDIHSEKLNREANKIKEKILKGTLVGNKEADLRETQLQSGKFTGGTRKALVTGGTLASISQAIQRGKFASAAGQAGKVGKFARGATSVSNVATRFGGALGRGGTGFAKTLQHGGGFKDAFKAAFRGFGRESGLTKKMAELAKAFKAGGPGSMAGRLKDFIQPFKDGAARGRRIRELRTGIKGKGFGPDLKRLMPKGFKGNIGNFLGSLKDLGVKTKNITKELGGEAGKFGRFASEKTGRGGLNFLGRNFIKKPAQFLGRQASRLSGATLGRGVNAIAGTQVGQAFRAGRAGQMLTSRGGAFQQLGTAGAGRAGPAQFAIKNTAGTRVANILGKSTKTIGQFSKNLSQQGGKKLLGKGLEGAGKLGGKAFAGMGRGIPLIGAAISAGFGAYEAKQAGESTSGILGGAVLGGLTGSAYAGDSIFTSLANMAGADIERGGTIDKGLGILGAGLHGGTIGAGIGTAVGGPVGTLVGAGVGAALGVGAELLKIANSVERVADAREVEQELVLKTGTTTETLGLKLAADGSALSSSRETGISGFEEAARQRDALLASTQQGASPILAPTSVQAAGGPAVVGGGPLPEVITGGGAAVGGVSGGFDQAGLMQVMNAFSQNIGSFGVEMKRFNDGLAQNINELKNLKFKIKLDGPTNVNVNFKNTGFLSQLTEGLKEELLRIVAEEMVPRIDHNTGGDHIMRNGV